MSLVARLAPAGVAAVEMRDIGQPVALHPQEECFVAGSVEKRRREFALGRACARAALARCGVADPVIAQDAARRPVWPNAMVGSITHTITHAGGYAAALAAFASDYAGVGVDGERIGGVTENLYRRLFGAGEAALLAACNGQDRLALATLLFTAKEACFKALVAVLEQPPSFSGMTVRVTGGTFTVQVPGLAAPVSGASVAEDDLVVSCAWIAR